MVRVVGYGHTILVPERVAAKLVAEGALRPCRADSCPRGTHHPRSREVTAKLHARYGSAARQSSPP